ncbi:MAG TPA: biopolymer transporter ExbD [Algoriphagus sp.]|jgi:biopolymer transport protein ExbD|uniref:Biopolymer transport protein ExbD n=1 Tax=Algoriphagus ornithinivorans TaxID=226506 RepID=A0A1I5AES3_9BACT|nr:MULTISPECIES: biopolymer transporter ExbD [Algoriphagus]MAL15115.1 biopolymer transporter ExbD [Algoriphagus sp.]MAN87880.1 biopolymer transporter ExbD [Algoriphagus sp.]QYH39683.1 biopolymer transporter ExbD [Algoriphagus sp. NBT04N3]SFN60689.1 Biopolymer transport protein ExbD [Algoriphagus ornithinivorans]HAD51667.1 biopolymer transporter ExbD [Algoriphagus sp.]|tara:strand:- start:7221 stop:7850 length:630 start_codon:yes stop_codon:yes gene_type:complete
MARKKNRMSQEVNAGSMADIAFLLLIFFLVTTTIASDKGILNVLPPKLDPNNPPPEIDKNERNIFTILINANDQLLVEGEYAEADGLDEKIKLFVLNFGQPNEEAQGLYNSLPASLKAMSRRDPESSDHPGEAVVSIKTNRGTSYDRYLEVFDLAKKAYFEIYAERVNLRTEEYRALTGKDEAEQSLIDRGKEGIPMAISIAEPDKIGS